MLAKPIQTPAVASLHAELDAAGPGLTANDDLLRSVLSGCGDCIKILDLDGRLQFMSEGGKRVMEVDDFSSLKGCPWPDFWAGQGNLDAALAVEAAKLGETARFKGAADTAKGTPRYWDVQVSPIFGPDGKPIHLLSISRDITDRMAGDVGTKGFGKAPGGACRRIAAPDQEYVGDGWCHCEPDDPGRRCRRSEGSFRGPARGPRSFP
jgi:hypothetical protein